MKKIKQMASKKQKSLQTAEGDDEEPPATANINDEITSQVNHNYTTKGGSRRAEKSRKELMMMNAAKLGWEGAGAGKEQGWSRSRAGVGIGQEQGRRS